MERPFFPPEIDARRELARIGLISKEHSHPQKIQSDIIVDPRWQANLEAKQGHFQLDRYRPFAFQHGSMVYNPRDHEWIPNASDNPWAICPGQNPQHEYHVIHKLGWSLQLTKVTLIFDVKSESIYYGKIRNKCDLERGYCPPNHAKATVIWEPKDHCRIFDVGRSHARMIKFQKRYFIEVLENTKSIQKHLYDESALSRFEVLLTKPIHKCNEDRPYYATQYQDIFVQYKEGLNFVTGKASEEFKDIQVTIPEGAPPLTPYAKADIRN